MSEKTERILWAVAGLGFAAAALIFLFLSITRRAEYDWALPVGLLCAALGSLFLVIRTLRERKK